MRGHSVGGYGSVTTNKVIATIGGEVFGMDVQAYPKYGSEKKGLPTTYYLTIAKEHIRVHSELEHVEFVALNDVNAFNLENPLVGLRPAAWCSRQSQKTDPAEIWKSIPAWARKELCDKKARLFALDTVGIAQKVSSRADLQQRMQGIVLLGIFLRITPFQAELALSDEEVFRGVEKSLRKYFGKRGERVVQDNLEAVRSGYREVIEIPREVMLVDSGGRPGQRRASGDGGQFMTPQHDGNPSVRSTARGHPGQRSGHRRLQRARGRRIQQRPGRAGTARRRSDRARSVVPAGTGALRDFSYIAPDIPEFLSNNCVGCMDCVTQCPDTAILGKVVEPAHAGGAAGRNRRRSAAQGDGRAMGRHQQVLHRPREEGHRRRQVRHLHRPHQVQGMRRMRGCLRRSRRPAHDSQERRQHAVVQGGVEHVQVHAGDAREIHQ